jgi:hemerythrin-like metal-binding protein
MTPLLEWGDELNTGDALVDSQHKALFQMVNALHEVIVSRNTRSVMSGVLGGLERYVGEHFAAEARLMERTGYPSMNQHLMQHEIFTGKTHEIIEEYRSGKLVLGLAISQYLGRWLTCHILTEDKRMIMWTRVHKAPAEIGSDFRTNVINRSSLGAPSPGGSRGSESRLKAAVALARDSIGHLPVAGKKAGVDS